MVVTILSEMLEIPLFKSKTTFQTICSRISTWALQICNRKPFDMNGLTIFHYCMYRRSIITRIDCCRYPPIVKTQIRYSMRLHIMVVLNILHRIDIQIAPLFFNTWSKASTVSLHWTMLMMNSTKVLSEHPRCLYSIIFSTPSK